MGRYRITITGLGNHGHAREVKAGGEIPIRPCEQPDGCVDCIAQEFVKKLRGASSVEHATLEHWTGKPGVVIDDLVFNERACGDF